MTTNRQTNKPARKQHVLLTKDEYGIVFLKGIFTSKTQLDKASEKQQALGLWVSTRTVDVNTDDIDIYLTNIAERGIWERKNEITTPKVITIKQ